MPDSIPFRQRLAVLRRRLRPDPANPPSRWVPRHRRKLVALAAAIAAVAVFDAWLSTCGFEGCPSREQIRAYRPGEGGRILDRNGRLLGRLAIVRRINVPLSDVPLHVQQAFVATEDRRFYSHGGFDWRALARATIRNLAHLRVREGFSTITMQVARNTFLAERYNGRSLRRKLIELRLARLLERELDKDKLLEIYLNAIYLGNGVHGIEAASRDLFGKSAGRLTVAEGAMLAALPKAPSSYTPRRDRERALARRNLVLRLMEREGYLTEEQVRTASQQPLRIADRQWRPSVADEPSALDAVRAFVDSVRPDALKEGDIVVHTTLDGPLQRAADRVVVRQTSVITRETAAWGGRPPEHAQGAYVAMDPATGDIRAVVTGRREQRRGFNHAFSARRQPGSAFKPFVYAAALGVGLSPASMVHDEPVQVAMQGQLWTPANYNGSYQGRVTLRRALMVSANAAAVRVSRTVGEQNFVIAARRNGVMSPLPLVPALALGAAEVTPLELVTAYAPFGNGGFRITPRLVRRIEAPDGTVLWSREIQPRQPALDAREAHEITSMLRAVVDYGTGRSVRDAGVSGAVAGKTGTTNGGTDVWFVGYTPSLVAGVWFGYDTPRPISGNASGGRLAAPAWAAILRAGWREPPGSAWPVPDGMVAAVIDPESGQLATDWCPRRNREWFRPHVAPREPCTLHVPPPDPIIVHLDADGRGRGQSLPQALESLGRRLLRIFRF